MIQHNFMASWFLLKASIKIIPIVLNLLVKSYVMKRKMFIISAGFVMFFAFIFPLHSQETLEVKPIEGQISKGMQPGYVVEIPMAVLQDVQQDWIKKLQENTKLKVEIVKDELIFSNAVKGEIASDTINLYTLFIQKDVRLLMYVFLEIDDVFFSSKGDQANLSVEKIDNGLKKYIRDFAVNEYKAAAAKDLDAEQKLLVQKQKELDKLVKDKEGLEKNNSSLENEIDQAEREVADMERQIELKNEEMNAHNTSMLSITGQEEKKAAAEKKKDLEKEKSKLEKNRTGAKNEISDMKSSIDKNNKMIEDNLKQQESKQAEIEAQNQEVAKAQAFLDGIK